MTDRNIRKLAAQIGNMPGGVQLLRGAAVWAAPKPEYDYEAGRATVTLPGGTVVDDVAAIGGGWGLDLDVSTSVWLLKNGTDLLVLGPTSGDSRMGGVNLLVASNPDMPGDARAGAGAGLVESAEIDGRVVWYSDTGDLTLEFGAYSLSATALEPGEPYTVSAWFKAVLAPDPGDPPAARLSFTMTDDGNAWTHYEGWPDVPEGEWVRYSMSRIVPDGGPSDTLLVIGSVTGGGAGSKLYVRDVQVESGGLTEYHRSPLVGLVERRQNTVKRRDAYTFHGGAAWLASQLGFRIPPGGSIIWRGSDMNVSNAKVTWRAIAETPASKIEGGIYVNDVLGEVTSEDVFDSSETEFVVDQDLPGYARQQVGFRLSVPQDADGNVLVTRNVDFEYVESTIDFPGRMYVPGGEVMPKGYIDAVTPDPGFNVLDNTTSRAVDLWKLWEGSNVWASADVLQYPSRKMGVYVNLTGRVAWDTATPSRRIAMTRIRVKFPGGVELVSPEVTVEISGGLARRAAIANQFYVTGAAEPDNIGRIEISVEVMQSSLGGSGDLVFGDGSIYITTHQLRR